MAIKNYYLILGVPRSESQAGIRSAYRKLAKKYHPDKTGEEESRCFRDIHEAYQTLSDPGKRKGYNLRLKEQEGGTNTCPRHTKHTSRESSRPAQNQHSFTDTSREEMGGRGGIFEDFFGGIFRDENHRHARGEDFLEYDVYLTRQETESGVRVELRFPASAVCIDCEGRGENWLFSCRHCGGSGKVEHWQTMEVNIPAGSGNGSKYRISIPDGPEKYLHLILHIHIISP